MQDLSLRSPPSLAVAEGATAPVPASGNPVIWSSTENKHLLWDGAKWGAVASFAELSGKQDALVSGTSIKTINGASLLGSGNIAALVSGGALGTPSSGNLSNCTADGTSAVGFRGIPQNSKSANYTLVMADAGKHILHPSADTTARTFTVLANSSIAFPIGTAITFVNQHGGGLITITVATDTMRLAGVGTTGSRTLAANGIATAIKVTATEWIISGVGLT